jgi:N-acetylglucosamine-6-phosphate deacetylase
MRLGVEAAIVEGKLVAGDVEVADGRIADVGLAATRGGGLAVPGFVDLQVNGFGGVDFAAADAAGYDAAGEALLETGVTAYQPTLITAPEEGHESSACTSKGHSCRRNGSERIRPTPGAIPTSTCSSGSSRRGRSLT